jgi:hypothetical protein
VVSIAGERAFEVMNVTGDANECAANAVLAAASPDLRGLLAKNLLAWESEEASVQAEHRVLIQETRALLARLPEPKGG